jgi:acyl-CoA reductase-like NAD-dependent aldehyde dehydrogenase
MKRGQKLKLVNPSTSKIFRELPYHSWEEVKARLKLSGQIQKEWKSASIDSRISLVQNAMKYFKENEDIIATDITLQMGKPIQQSKNEVRGMIHRAEICCGLTEDALKEISLPDKYGLKRFIKREPMGVVLDIAAWNYPLLIAINVIVPAVLAGNAVAIKHSSLTPLCAIAFEDAFKHGGAPEGLVTALIMDHTTTEKAIQSGLIHHVAFTGSVRGGRRVQTSASSQFMDVGLELGGKDPAYIREDANLYSAVPGIMDGVFYNAGQSCCAVERIYVHHSLFDEFVEQAAQFMDNLKIGDPMNASINMGPLAQKSGIKTVENQLKDATDKGSKILTYPGSVPDGENYILPAILINVNHQMEIMMEETFGPIVGIMAVQSDEEAINLMNDSLYGLTASVWTNDVENAIEIGSRIETGTFFMNRCDYLDPALPWVGIKDSGKGCTLSALGIQQLTRPKGYNLKLIH